MYKIPVARECHDTIAHVHRHGRKQAISTRGFAMRNGLNARVTLSIHTPPSPTSSNTAARKCVSSPPTVAVAALDPTWLAGAAAAAANAVAAGAAVATAVDVVCRVNGCIGTAVAGCASSCVLTSTSPPGRDCSSSGALGSSRSSGRDGPPSRRFGVSPRASCACTSAMKLSRRFFARVPFSSRWKPRAARYTSSKISIAPSSAQTFSAGAAARSVRIPFSLCSKISANIL